MTALLDSISTTSWKVRSILPKGAEPYNAPRTRSTMIAGAFEASSLIVSVSTFIFLDKSEKSRIDPPDARCMMPNPNPPSKNFYGYTVYPPYGTRKCSASPQLYTPCLHVTTTIGSNLSRACLSKVENHKRLFRSVSPYI
jgi:hypothetical protein